MLSNYGAKLILVARTESKLDETLNSCQKDSVNKLIIIDLILCAYEYFALKKAIKFVGDINDFSIHAKIIQTALDKFGKIDILVNNAGIVHLDGIESIDESQYDQLMNTNLRSLIFLTKACVPNIIKQKGSKKSLFFQKMTWTLGLKERNKEHKIR